MIDTVKCDRMAGFLIGAQQLGYSLNNAWDLLLSSEQGNGLLNDEYAYAVHHQGIATAEKADASIGFKYKKGKPKNVNIDQMLLLANFIEFTNKTFNVPYKDIFKKISIQDFMKTCGAVLGNYDDKIVKGYIL